MRTRHVRTVFALVVCSLLLLSAPAFAQGEPQGYREQFAEPPAPSAAEPAAPSPDAALGALTPRVWLPMLRDSEIEVRFGSTANQETGEITAPGIVFPAGILRLYVDARFTGVQGLTYRTDAIFPSGQRLRGVNLSATRALHYDRYYLCRTTAFRCGIGEVPLLAGPYTVEVFLNDRLVSTWQAAIR
jgi:hypothetical protein